MVGSEKRLPKPLELTIFWPSLTENVLYEADRPFEAARPYPSWLLSLLPCPIVLCKMTVTLETHSQREQGHATALLARSAPNLDITFTPLLAFHEHRHGQGHSVTLTLQPAFHNMGGLIP